MTFHKKYAAFAVDLNVFSKEYKLGRNVNLFLAPILLISHYIRVKANDGWIS